MIFLLKINKSGKNLQSNNIPSTPGVQTGQISPGAVWAVDFMCALPYPKGIGGLCVGSWQSFSAEIVLSGGWVNNSGSGSSSGSNLGGDKSRVGIILRAFISL